MLLSDVALQSAGGCGLEAYFSTTLRDSFNRFLLSTSMLWLLPCSYDICEYTQRASSLHSFVGHVLRCKLGRLRFEV